MLMRAASALVHRGVEPEAITDLSFLVKPENVELVLRFMLDRPGKPQTSTSQMGTLLAKVAKYWAGAEVGDVEKIKKWAAKIAPQIDGLSKRNRERLAPLRDEKNLIKLFALPKKIREEIEKRSTGSRRDALLTQHAVALSILTFAPIRIGNLAGLRLDQHLRWSEPGMRGQLVIQLNGSEVKNAQVLTFPLPAQCADLIRLYLRRYHAQLTTAATTFLFPGPDPRKPKRADTLSKQLTGLIHRTIGLEVNPHLYRHLVHLVVLNRYPGAYAMVSRVLGHKSLQTAISNYAGEDVAIAMRAFQDLVGDVMSGASARRAATNSAVADGLTRWRS